MEIVPRTPDVEQFTTFYDLLNHKSQNLVINIFSGATRHKRTHAFYFNEGRQNNTLNGIDTQKVVDEQVARFTLDFQNKALSDQVKDLKDELVSLEEENDQLKADNTTLREDLKKATGENGIASSIMGGMERLFDRYMTPGKAQQQNLSGPPQQGQTPPPGTVILPLHEYDQFKSFAVLADKFEQHELNKVLHILNYFAENKPAIDETMNFLTEDEENPQQDDTQEDHH